MFAAFQRLSLFLVGLSLPMQGYSFLDFSFGMTPFKAATAILLLVGVVQFAVTGRRLPRDRKRSWMVAFFMSYLLACVVSILSGTSFPEVLIVMSTYVSLVLYYFLIGYVVTSRRDLVLLLWALLIGGAVTAAPAFLGLQQAGRGLGAGERYTGLAGQENVLGFDMAVCLAIGAGLYFSTRSLLRRGVALGLAIGCILGLLLSLSRSAFVSLVGMSTFWFVRGGLARSARYIVPLVALVLGVALFAPQSVVDRVGTMTDSGRRAEDGSIQSRFAQLELALRAIASSPLIGIGVNRFIPWANEQRGVSGIKTVVHNAYLTVAVEQGLLGLFLYMGILLLTWSDYSRCIREVRGRERLRDPSLAEFRHLAYFLQIALLGGLIGGAFHPAQKSKTVWLLLAISPVLLSLCRARILELEPQRDKESALDLAGFGAASLPSRSVSPG